MEKSRQEIRGCTAFDGTGLAYVLVGKGPPLIKEANCRSSGKVFQLFKLRDMTGKLLENHALSS